MNQDTFASRLIEWYEYHKRDLPWRHTNDPYHIWLSEIILQQTRVKQGLPYYQNFVKAFPTIFDLAAAPEQEVLRLWQGLGYYSRARNMQETAKAIVNQQNGSFPNSYIALVKLKGIGPYTAAAIASFAFKESVAVLDGNVFRVLARLYGLETDIATSKAKTLFSTLANQLISSDSPDLYNQAIMEFGAIQCTHSSPDCLLCPFQQECEAFLTGRQNILPIKSKKTVIKNRFFHYIVFHVQNRIAMRLRGSKDIWQGLYDFWLSENDSILDTDELVKQLDLDLSDTIYTIKAPEKAYTHLLSHQRIEARFWHIQLEEVPQSQEGLTFYTLEEVEQLPKPILINKYLSEHFF
ncbi:A/G-specific adenine glycosylase [Cytophagaceae bacterium BD1B2-1]|uniref:Adenine DNA glycosylase n=1 Tax=Xanthocytophaga agilis TaxID=3048010 RepID=A0AAE3R5E3_9BACT|nr:A/G-specific adenine glycosylase [Xanthocytophaga agilis]